MIGHLFTDVELDLVLELLESDQRRLMQETRHTDARKMREDLRERIRTIERLIERFQQVKAGTYSAA